MSISVIIPTLNEVDLLPACVEAIRKEFRGELIVADGGSNDGTSSRAMELGARLYQSEPGLAAQCNAGAEEAMGSVLFFVPAEVRPPFGWRSEIEAAMESPYVLGGCFPVAYLEAGVRARLLDLEQLWRSRLHGFSLAQSGIFVRRSTFLGLGGMDVNSEVPMAALAHQLKQQGKFLTLSPNARVRDPGESWLSTWRRHGRIFRALEENA